MILEISRSNPRLYPLNMSIYTDLWVVCVCRRTFGVGTCLIAMNIVMQRNIHSAQLLFYPCLITLIEEKLLSSSVAVVNVGIDCFITLLATYRNQKPF